MPVSRTAAVALFPTRGAIPEELQIGRASAIGDITSAAEGGTTLIFAEDRRLGKSSMLLAMTDRILRELVIHHTRNKREQRRPPRNTGSSAICRSYPPHPPARAQLTGLEPPTAPQ